MQGSIHFSLNGRHLSNLMYDSEFSYVEVCSEINMTYRIIELVISLARLSYRRITSISILFSISY